MRTAAVVVVLVAILLAHLKKDAVEVKKALLSMDEGLLTPECLKQLIDFAPDDDEVRSATDITSPPRLYAPPHARSL